jgi:hypothetical protein
LVENTSDLQAYECCDAKSAATLPYSDVRDFGK